MLTNHQWGLAAFTWGQFYRKSSKCLSLMSLEITSLIILRAHLPGANMMRHIFRHIFRVTGPLCREFNGHWWIPRTKASDAELWCFSLICAWINGRVNKHEAGDLRHHRTHYYVILMNELMISQDWLRQWLGGINPTNQMLCKLQWNLYKATTRFHGLSRQVVFHDRENKHDFVKTVPGKL